MSSSSLIKVLVVDDEQSIRRSLQEFLDDFNFAVTTADSAEAALKLIADHHFDVGIIDLRLPGMNGDVLIKNAHQMNPKMKFIIHTGSVGYQISQELLNAGMKPEHVFLKPLPDLNMIADAIREFFPVKNK
jgi:DNA-binding NtrC family response regulator